MAVMLRRVLGERRREWELLYHRIDKGDVGELQHQRAGIGAAEVTLYERIEQLVLLHTELEVALQDASLGSQGL